MTVVCTEMVALGVEINSYRSWTTGNVLGHFDDSNYVFSSASSSINELFRWENLSNLWNCHRLSRPSMRVIDELDKIAEVKDYPKKLRLNNGPEFISKSMTKWANEHPSSLSSFSLKTHVNSYIKRLTDLSNRITKYVCIQDLTGEKKSQKNGLKNITTNDCIKLKQQYACSISIIPTPGSL